MNRTRLFSASSDEQAKEVARIMNFHFPIRSVEDGGDGGSFYTEGTLVGCTHGTATLAEVTMERLALMMTGVRFALETPAHG